MKHLTWLIVCLVCLSARAAGQVRTWTDVDGRTMQAQFIREVDGDVAFLKDGKLITVPLDRLSEADRKTIRELEAAKILTDDAKPAGATPTFVDPAARTEKPPAAGASTSGPLPGSKDATPANRVWTDNRGNKFNAKFVRVHEGNVVLLRGARTMTIAFDSLSAGDQTHVRELLTARGEEGLLPPAAADNQISHPAALAPFESRPQNAESRGNEPPSREPEPDLSGAESPPPATTVQSDSQPSDQVQGGVAGPEKESRTSRLKRLKFENSQQIVQYFIGMPILAAIGSLIGAVILRAAAYWVLGGHLAYGDAYGTVFLANITYGVLAFFLAMVASNLPDDSAELLSLATAPVGFVVLSGIIASRHEVGFGEACLVSLVMILTWLVVLGIVVVLGAGVIIGLKTAS